MTPQIMGIVNVTPDSFSDGGLYFDPDKAIAHGVELINAGADIIDIGGESTRPGSSPVTPADEIERIVPVFQGLAGKGAVLSIDTRHAATMEAALKWGAGMINDVTALTGDPHSIAVAQAANVPVCLMHMQGDPRTMQINPVYQDVTQDVLLYLLERAEHCGLKKENIILDPGLGFGKTLEHNLTLLSHLETFVASGYPVLLGASRKSFIAKLMAAETPDRLAGSLAAALRGVEAGVSILRVHDVAATVQAVKLWEATKPA